MIYPLLRRADYYYENHNIIISFVMFKRDEGFPGCFLTSQNTAGIEVMEADRLVER
jgi:hypothetical protein